MDYEFLLILIYLVYYYILFFIYRWYRLVLLLIGGIVKKVCNYVKDLNKLNIEVFIFFICIVFFFVLVSCFYRERLLM